jgi:hypothetical protein
LQSFLNAATNPEKSFRPSAHVQGRDATGQILKLNLLKTCLLHKERELSVPTSVGLCWRLPQTKLRTEYH